MDSKVNMPTNLAPMPQAPPMYPIMEPQPQYPIQQVLPSTVYYNGQPEEIYQIQKSSVTRDARPPSVFILNEKPSVGPEPMKSKCPHCDTMQVSRLVSKVSLKTHFAALLCCVFGLLCLVPVPYCMNAFKNLHHYCSNCGQYLGSYPAK